MESEIEKLTNRNAELLKTCKKIECIQLNQSNRPSDFDLRLLIQTMKALARLAIIKAEKEENKNIESKIEKLTTINAELLDRLKISNKAIKSVLDKGINEGLRIVIEVLYDYNKQTITEAEEKE